MNKFLGEWYKFVKLVKEVVKVYILYDGGGGSVSAFSSASYVDIVEALRELSVFYKKNGVMVEMSVEVCDRILLCLYEVCDLLFVFELIIMDKLRAL